MLLNKKRPYPRLLFYFIESDKRGFVVTVCDYSPKEGDFEDHYAVPVGAAPVQCGCGRSHVYDPSTKTVFDVLPGGPSP